MSSPARSSVSATSAGQGGGGSVGGAAASLGDDVSPFSFPTDLVSAQDIKEEALSVLKSEVMASLQKEVKSMDEDSWKFAGPRSLINLVSRPGAFPHKQPEEITPEISHDSALR